MDLLNFILKNSYLEINRKKFRIRRGVPQGSIISPLLFDIFMDDLIEFLKNKPSNENVEPEKHMLCYADDVAILFRGREKLNNIIKNLENWATRNEMSINKNKSGIMYIRKKDNDYMKSREKDQKIQGYPIVDEYKFLGINIAPNFDLNNHFNNLKKKIKYITYKALTLPRNCITPFHASILWTLLIRSNALYGLLMMNYLDKRQSDQPN